MEGLDVNMFVDKDVVLSTVGMMPFDTQTEVVENPIIVGTMPFDTQTHEVVENPSIVDTNISMNNDVVFTTETPTEVIKTPEVGMAFESREAAKFYYLQYAHQRGFSIRVRDSKRRGKGHNDFTVYNFVCAQGKRVVQDENEATLAEKRNTTTGKCECKAQMRVCLQQDGKLWRVLKFSDEHDHCMVSPSKKVLMKTMKMFPKVACMLAEKFREVNLPVSKVPYVLGVEHFGFNKRDCWNHLNSRLKMYKTPEDGDATAAYSYFKKKSAKDPFVDRGKLLLVV